MNLIVTPLVSDRPGTALLNRMRSWMSALAAIASDGAAPSDPKDCRSATIHHLDCRRHVAIASAAPPSVRGRVVPFPRSGEGALACMAHELRDRFAALGLDDCYPFILEVENADRPRLLIDRTAYVERADEASDGYRIVLEDAFAARITMESADLDTIRAFVGHYILVRLDPAMKEGRR